MSYLSVKPFSDPPQVQIYFLQKTSEMPQCWIHVAELLKQIHISNSRRDFIAPPVVMLPENDARICLLFNKNAKYLFGDRASWPIRSFGNHDDYSVTPNYRIQGILLELENEKQKCPLKVLQHSYNSVFQSMIHGWVESNIENYPDIFFKENSDDFALFIKTSSLLQEDALIYRISYRFSLQNNVRCHHMWHPPSNCYSKSHRGQIYLWVRKSALNDVMDKFGFQFKKKKATCAIL